MSWMQIIKKLLKIFRFHWFDIMLFSAETWFYCNLNLMYIVMIMVELKEKNTKTTKYKDA